MIKLVQNLCLIFGSLLIFSSFGFAQATTPAQPDLLVITVDSAPQTRYTIENQTFTRATLRAELRRQLGNAKSQMRPIMVLIDDRSAIQELDFVDGLVTAVGFDAPRFFAFGRDKRVMVEIAKVKAYVFSKKGVLQEAYPRH